MKTMIQKPKSGALSDALQSSFGTGLLAVLILTLPMQTSSARIEAVRVATGLALPLYVCAPPGDTGRIFIAEQHGMIKIFDFHTNTVLPTPYLDITDEVGTQQGNGILGMTFDPDYAVNGHFYVSYTTDLGGVFDRGVSHIARFTVSADPNIADRESEVTVLTSDRPGSGHNVDWIGFSPRPGDRGNLYICGGDVGGSEDKGDGHDMPDGNGQST